MITQTDGSTGVAEGGRTDTFSITLSHMPAAAVTVVITADSDLILGRGTAAPSTGTISATIQPASWNVPQFFTVGAVDDSLAEGPEVARLSMSVTSTDTAFGRLTGLGLNVTVTDNNSGRGLAVVETGGSTRVTEGGAGDLVTLALSMRPTAAVTLTITAGAELRMATGGGAPASVQTIVFTTSNWASPRALTIEAVDDGIAQGPHLAHLGFQFSSADPNYNDLAISPFAVLVADPAQPRCLPLGGITDHPW